MCLEGEIQGSESCALCEKCQGMYPQTACDFFLILFFYRLFTMTKNGSGKCTSSTMPASGGTNGSPSHSSHSTQVLTLLSWKYHQACCSCVSIMEMTPLSWLKHRPSSLLLRWCLSWRSLRVADQGVTWSIFRHQKAWLKPGGTGGGGGSRNSSGLTVYYFLHLTRKAMEVL